MKRRARAIWLATFSLAIAATALYADMRKGDYSPAQLGSLQQRSPMPLSADSTYQTQAYPVSTLDLAPGDGVQETRIYCNTCHTPRYITMQPPLPAATWEAEINKMSKAFGAEIPEDSTRKIVAYLKAHYTADNRK
jgi:hypothetical protein